MSDMYVQLTSRIPVVASRTHLGTARIQEAQDQVGLSNESIARQIPVSEKTWRRWKEAGEIPTAALPAVARVLRIQLLEVTPATITVDGSSGNGSDQEVAQRLHRIEETLAAILARFDEL